ncbi:MAG: hypothetical protein J6M03_03995 [Clostridia bacterium]|nr:hypothetical protein [Clostridia bacterium]
MKKHVGRKSMEALLTGAAGFVLQSAASLGIDKGTEALAKRLSNKSLLKTDEKVREYLSGHLDDFEYEQLDRFLGKEGVYAHDQASCNWSVMAAYTDRIVEDFYSANSSLKLEQKTLTPLIQQTVIETYQSVISQLSMEGRIIYQQQISNREEERREHKRLEEDIQSIKDILAQSQNKLSFSNTIKIYDILAQMILTGNFSSITPLSHLFENQIDDRDRSYCTALNIYFSCFTASQHDIDTLCVQFVRDNPIADLTKNVVTFLIQMEQKSALKILLSFIADSKLSSLVSAYISDDSSDVKHITNADGTLKDEYLTNEAALWLFANYSKKDCNRTAMLSAYSKINQLNPTTWVRWLIEETNALLAFYDSFSAPDFNVMEMRCQINKLLEFSTFFSQVIDSLQVEYIDTLLTCAKFLSIDEFDLYYNRLDSHMKKTPQAKKHWYSAHFIDNSVNAKELKSFCDETNDDKLWSAYLSHISTKSPEFVITCIREKEELLQKEIVAIVAYYEALCCVSGEEAAFDTIRSISIFASLVLPYNIFLTQVCIKQANGKEDEYLQTAVTETLNPSHDIAVMNLRDLAQLLVSKNRWLEASEILEKYQDKDPFIMFLRLKVLISHEDQFEVCASLIEKLEGIYGNNAHFMYCKGVISENNLPGLGMELFESAFRITPTPQYAQAVLASRINRKIFVDDEILHFAYNHDNVDLLYISGVTYARQEKKQESHKAFLQGLINCNGKYHEGLCCAFVAELLGHRDDTISPSSIEPRTCCILTKESTEEQSIEEKLQIWLHNEDVKIIENTNDFNGYSHVLPNSQLSFALLGLKNGDFVELNDGNYTVEEICSEDTVVLNYCIQVLQEHKVMKRVEIDTENLSAFFDEMRKSGEERSNHINEMLEKYKTLNPGLPIELFAYAIGKPYYKSLYALLYDENMPFWSGTDGVEISKDCILTPSVVGVFSALGIHPPTGNNSCVKFYVPNALKVELDLFSREHRNDNTSAVLGFKDDGQPYMIENTPESMRNMNRYFACLNEWANWGEALDPILPNDYPADIQSNSNALGIPNIEAVVWAKRKDCLVCCDDLFMRKYMRSEDIDAPTAMDMLICLGYSFDFIMDKVATLLELNYISPITMNFLKWVSDCFSQADSEETLGQYSLSIIDLFDKIFNILEQRSYFLCIYQQVIDQKVNLHTTLKWIITSFLLKYFRESKQ